MLNFDGAAKGNSGPAGFGGAVRNHEGQMLGIFWGDLGYSSNNLAELEGLVQGLKWATVIGWSPLIVEGDSSLIIFMATRLQAGSSTSKISRNWRWESRIEELFSILQAFPAVTFRHIRHKENSVADAAANKGVGAGISFQSAFPNQVEEKEFFHRCQALAEANYISHVRLLSTSTSSAPL